MRNLRKEIKNISTNLLDSIYLLEILEILADGDGKECTLIHLIKQKTYQAFKKNEYCRSVIYRKN